MKIGGCGIEGGTGTFRHTGIFTCTCPKNIDIFAVYRDYESKEITLIFTGVYAQHKPKLLPFMKAFLSVKLARSVSFIMDTKTCPIRPKKIVSFLVTWPEKVGG